MNNGLVRQVRMQLLIRVGGGGGGGGGGAGYINSTFPGPMCQVQVTYQTKTGVNRVT